jgi:hypothetical protein
VESNRERPTYEDIALQVTAMSAHREWLDQFQEGYATRVYAGEVEAIRSPAVSPSMIQDARRLRREGPKRTGHRLRLVTRQGERGHNRPQPAADSDVTNDSGGSRRRPGHWSRSCPRISAIGISSAPVMRSPKLTARSPNHPTLTLIHGAPAQRGEAAVALRCADNSAHR